MRLVAPGAPFLPAGPLDLDPVPRAHAGRIDARSLLGHHALELEGLHRLREQLGARRKVAHEEHAGNTIEQALQARLALHERQSHDVAPALEQQIDAHRVTGAQPVYQRRRAERSCRRSKSLRPIPSRT